MSRNEMNDRDHRDELERALAEVLAEPLDDRQAEQAAARVWARLSAPNATSAAAPAASTISFPPLISSSPSTAVESGLQGCEDFRRQIPAYLRGELAPARALLLEDHTRECLPCRRALHSTRHGQIATATDQSGAALQTGPVAAGYGQELTAAWHSPRARTTAPWLAAAALLLVGLGLGLWWRLGAGAAAGGRMARVAAVEGQLLRIEGATSVPVAAGDAVSQGEQVRTAKGSRAVLRMNDGSQIEMAERAGLSLAGGSDGNTIDLERGRIIVQAAHQRPRHLYVATADCLVSVTGTIFAVNHGTKGSRVSVVEGEVHVKRVRLNGLDAFTQAIAEESVLRPGDQVTTHSSVESVPVRQEVSWSRDAARYDALLAELSAAGRDIDQLVARPGLRSSSRLLDLVPAGSLFYVALPNLAANLGQTQQLLEQRLAESPVLRQWWNQTLGSAENEARFHQLVQDVGDAGQFLGDEVVIAAGSAADSAEPGAPVLLAAVTQEASLRATLRQEIAAFNQRQGKTALVLLDALPAPAAGSPAPASAAPVLIWVGQGLLVASPSATQIAGVAASLQPAVANPFVGSSFHARLAQAYADGAGWLFAADLKQLLASRRSPTQPERQLADSMGLYDLEHFILERHDGAPAGAGGQAGTTGTTETRAVLTFSQPRRGITAWLAAPAPMGSLGFFSADANLVSAFVVKNPVELLDELLSLSPQFAAELAKAEAEHGFNLRDDLAAPLGGEIAFGLDGPVLPSPSWRLVAEVYDPVRLQQTFARAVQQANAELTAEGKPGVALTPEEAGGRTYYAITASQPQIEVHYVFVDGYLVVAPTRAQLDRALAQRAAGATLASSPRLRGLLGRDGQVNVSALFYQNLGPVLAPLGAVAGAIQGAAPSAGGRPALGSLMLGAGHGPSLLYAYAEAERIVFAGHGEAGPMGLNLQTLAGFGSILGGMDRAHDAAARARGGS